MKEVFSETDFFGFVLCYLKVLHHFVKVSFACFTILNFGCFDFFIRLFWGVPCFCTFKKVIFWYSSCFIDSEDDHIGLQLDSRSTSVSIRIFRVFAFKNQSSLCHIHGFYSYRYFKDLDMWVWGESSLLECGQIFVDFEKFNCSERNFWLDFNQELS